MLNKKFILNKKFFLSAIAALVFLSPLYSQYNSPQYDNSIPQYRSFNDLFPQLDEKTRTDVFADGIVRTIGKGGGFQFLPAADSGIDAAQRILDKKYPYLTESLAVIPYSGKILTVLDAYNALQNIQKLKGRLYRSATKNQDIPLFEDAVRMESATKNNPVPDPGPSAALPSSQSVYIRLKDNNFGNTYYRADISPQGPGLIYNLTNYRSISYMFFTVMKEEKFSACLYLEPLQEGMLIYSAGGADVSDFIAGMIDIPSAISKRLAVFIGWVSDGMREF
ncbi:MAG: hypothetical protein FWD78_04345 [Treponema sp.]|nr:hypothetical protein [Treponema sp.]